MTFEVDDHELLVSATQRLDAGARPTDLDDIVRFEVVVADLVDRFDTDTEAGVVQFTKKI